MGKGDRYRIIITISFVLLVISSVILGAGLWNNLSLNPQINIGYGFYFLVFLILILASIMFVFHLLEERQIFQDWNTSSQEIRENEKVDAKTESPLSAPYEIDIDAIAETIVPRIEAKEPLPEYAARILLNFSRHFEMVQGIIYLRNKKTRLYEPLCTYAYTSDSDPAPFPAGEGLAGQVAKSKTALNLASVPEGYLQVQSGLGGSSPTNLYIFPLLLNKETIGIIELASFHPIDEEMEWTFRNLARIIGNALITKIKSSERK